MLIQSTSWPSDGEGHARAAFHSALSRKHGERRMPIDRQRDSAVEGYSRRVEIEIKDVQL